MKAEIIQDIDYNDYDNFIKNNFSSFYHSKNHILFLKDLLKIDPHFIEVKENSETVGIMPFFIKKSKFGTVINSLPFFGSYGGYIKKIDCDKVILDELNNFNLENDVLSSVIISNPFMKNESSYENFYSFSFKEPRLTQSLDLTNKSKNDLWDSFEKRVRTSVRKSQKLNINISNTDLSKNVIDEFYKMHKTRIQSKDGKIKPNNFFANVKKHFTLDRDYEILCANMNGENISYLLVFYHNNSAVYYLPAYNTESKHTQSTSLLTWNSIISALKRKATFYNFGGTPKDELELYKFKRGWNASDFTYNYYVYCDLDKIKEIEISDVSKYYEFFYVVPFEQLVKN